MTPPELPRFVRDLLSSPPRRGEGVNLWLFRVARVLHAFRAPAEIVETLRAATAGEAVRHGEIERAVSRSKAFAWTPGAGAPASRPAAWPSVNIAARSGITAGGAGLPDLWEASPTRLDDDKPHAEEIIDALFPGNPLLCVGKDKHTFATRRRETWRGRLATLPHVVPSPMIAQKGRTQEGRESEHTLSGTGPRRFVVIEQDSGTADEQSAVLLHLAERAPLALAVHSGGKSVHGWFFCEGQPEAQVREFMRYAVTLGADRSMWTRSQFTRMPDGTHKNGNRQTVFFFNPGVLR